MDALDETQCCLAFISLECLWLAEVAPTEKDEHHTTCCVRKKLIVPYLDFASGLEWGRPAAGTLLRLGRRRVFKIPRAGLPTTYQLKSQALSE